MPTDRLLMVSISSVRIISLLSLLLGGCSGASFEAMNGEGGSKKDPPPTAEPASDPVVVTGAYLTCEQIGLSTGIGDWSSKTSLLGCNAMTSQGVVKPHARGLDMTAVFEMNSVTQEKKLDFSKDKHVSIQISNHDLPSLKFWLKGYPRQSNANTADLLLYCGDAGNGCYGNDVVKKLEVAKLPYWDLPISYEKADPKCANNCFNLWIRKIPFNGKRMVLNARGTSDINGKVFPWQSKLDVNASVWGGWIEYPDHTTSLAGRACPRRTMRFDPQNPEANSCLYYDIGFPDQTNKGLAPDLKEWGAASWYVGNHSICSNKGMRLPTLYETDIQFDTSFSMFNSVYFPATSSISTEDIFSNAPGTGIPPFGNLGTWTASSNAENKEQYFIWGVVGPWTNELLQKGRFFDKFNNSSGIVKAIRCVLPSSH